jgi:integrase
MARRTWTDKSVAALKFGPKRRPIPDPQLPGHYLRGRDGGPATFYATTRDPTGKQVWHKIGSTALYRLDESRELARTAIKAIKAGKAVAGPQSFEDVAAEWFDRRVIKRGLRSANHTRGYLDLHILPAWKSRDFESIRRNDVAKLLDHVEDNSGAAAADAVLKTVGAIFNWYATRHEDYGTPVVRGMRRHHAKENARDRILDDDELRAVWKQAEANGPFGAFLRLLLLTGQRKDKVARIKWDHLTDYGSWIIETAPREKGNAGELMLPQVALDIIAAQPRLVGNDYLFPGRGKSAMRGFAKRKESFCAKLPSMPNWTLHDLRRTARSLMSRAGVNDRHAERVLGHVIGGVEGTYDRHEYREEKAHALRALAGLIEKIVNPPADNVVSMSSITALVKP